MAISPSFHACNPAADNDLYDRGFDLVEAAMAIRRLAADPEAGRAIPALLGCLETALHELECATSCIDESAGSATPTQDTADGLHRAFMNLGLALADAEMASTAARVLAGRAVAADAHGRPRRNNDVGQSHGDLADRGATPRRGETQ